MRRHRIPTRSRYPPPGATTRHLKWASSIQSSSSTFALRAARGAVPALTSSPTLTPSTHPSDPCSLHGSSSRGRRTQARPHDPIRDGYT